MVIAVDPRMRRKHVTAGISSHSAVHKTTTPRRRRPLGLTMLLVSLVLFGAKTQAQPLAEKDEKAQREAWTKYYVQQLPKYKFYTGSNLKQPLEVISEAKLRWGNPVRVGRTHGELFVWTNEGRGAVVGNILSYDFGDDQRRVAHEFHSFDTEDLLCKYEGESQRILDVTERDVEEVISRWTGVPIASVRGEEMERLLSMEKGLHRRVVGQDEAISALARAIRRSRAGLRNRMRPVFLIYLKR